MTTSFAVFDTISKPFMDAQNQTKIQEAFAKRNSKKEDTKEKKEKFNFKSKNKTTTSKTLSKMKGGGSNTQGGSFGVFVGDYTNQCDYY